MERSKKEKESEESPRIPKNPPAIFPFLFCFVLNILADTRNGLCKSWESQEWQTDSILSLEAIKRMWQRFFKFFTKSFESIRVLPESISNYRAPGIFQRFFQFFWFVEDKLGSLIEARRWNRRCHAAPTNSSHRILLLLKRKRWWRCGCGYVGKTCPSPI